MDLNKDRTLHVTQFELILSGQTVEFQFTIIESERSFTSERILEKFNVMFIRNGGNDQRNFSLLLSVNRPSFTFTIPSNAAR